jgi:uncharacterized protein YciI
MDKKYYAVKLIPSRPTFAQDMTPEEREVMKAHSAYWRSMMPNGTVLVFGPVLDPAGVYGLGIIAAENDEQVHAFMAGDPSTTINTYEFYQMLAVVKE